MTSLILQSKTRFLLGMSLQNSRKNATKTLFQNALTQTRLNIQTQSHTTHALVHLISTQLSLTAIKNLSTEFKFSGVKFHVSNTGLEESENHSFSFENGTPECCCRLTKQLKNKDSFDA